MPEKEKDDSFDEETWTKSIINSFTENFTPKPNPRRSLVVKTNSRTGQIETIQFNKQRSMIP